MKKHNFRRDFKRFNNYNLMGGYIKRFSVMYILLLFTVAFFELVLFIRESIFPHHDTLRHSLYLIDYTILFAASLSNAIFLLVTRKKQNNEKIISFIIHIYALVGLAWGVCVSLLDYVGGNEFPVVFFTIIATIGGLLVLNPFIYIPLIIASGAGLVTAMYFLDPSLLKPGNIINIVVLYVMIAVVTYRTTAVAVSDEDQRNLLMKISNLDVLTGLKNENAYYRFIDKLDKDIVEGKITDFAVIAMDVNGLKWTDDTYGHRYGASLISAAGRILPKVFKNSEIFHTGGDEFVCIIIDEYEKVDAFLDDFEERLTCTPIIYEGTEITLSLARGVARHEPGEKYGDTFQRADDDMYKNKIVVKEKYHINSREK